mmetsp:Transcript_36154/g.93895  ORF Transcript_36154/g.93895 Transcript_36154/m.93895 type:complete len:247 (-) Transcript_36154:49-789(-)
MMSKGASLRSASATRSQSPEKKRTAGEHCPCGGRPRLARSRLARRLGAVRCCSTSALKSAKQTSAAPASAANTPGSPCPQPSSSTRLPEHSGGGSKSLSSGERCSPHSRHRQRTRSSLPSHSLNPPSYCPGMRSATASSSRPSSRLASELSSRPLARMMSSLTRCSSTSASLLACASSGNTSTHGLSSAAAAGCPGPPPTAAAALSPPTAKLNLKDITSRAARNQRQMFSCERLGARESDTFFEAG